MKTVSHLSFAAIVAAASFSLGFIAIQYSGIFFSMVSCTFLLLIAATDYGRSSRYQRSTPLMVKVDSTGRSTQPLRLAA